LKKSILELVKEMIRDTKESHRLLDESMQDAYGDKWQEEKRRQEIDKEQIKFKWEE